jgi:hypothetical protein
MHRKFYSENLMGIDHLKDLDIDGRIALKLTWIGCEDVDCIQLAQDASGGLLKMRQQTFRFH